MAAPDPGRHGFEQYRRRRQHNQRHPYDRHGHQPADAGRRVCEQLQQCPNDFHRHVHSFGRQRYRLDCGWIGRERGGPSGCDLQAAQPAERGRGLGGGHILRLYRQRHRRRGGKLRRRESVESAGCFRERRRDRDHSRERQRSHPSGRSGLRHGIPWGGDTSYGDGRCRSDAAVERDRRSRARRGQHGAGNGSHYPDELDARRCHHLLLGHRGGADQSGGIWADPITFTGTELLGRPEANSISISVVPDSSISLTTSTARLQGARTRTTSHRRVPPAASPRW